MPKYWFRQKRFGYGATPNTWQGWLVTLAGVGLVVGVVLASQHMQDHQDRILMLFAGLTLVLIPFVTLCYVKTEGGWRWRSGRD